MPDLLQPLLMSCHQAQRGSRGAPWKLPARPRGAGEQLGRELGSGPHDGHAERGAARLQRQLQIQLEISLKFQIMAFFLSDRIMLC